MMLSIFKSFFKSFFRSVRRKSSHRDLREGLRGDRSFFKNLFSRLFVIGDRVAIRVKGFTLIELLISILISTVIISTLLAFTVNIMETDRREQAKVESQGDVQAALNYISNDLQEAVYIYNADSLNYNNADAAPGPGIKDQLPDATVDPVFASDKSTPVLVFWKRKYFAPDTEVSVGGSTKKVGCLEYGTTTTNSAAPAAPSGSPVPTATPVPNATCDGNNPVGAGRYTYALVAYYLIYDNPAGTNSSWSNAARIGRWELSDGIRATCQSSDITTCADPKPVARIDVTAAGALAGSSNVNYWTLPDQGFRPFDTSGGLIDALMNKWTKSPAGYASSNVPKILVDFIDDTPYSTDQDDGTGGNTPTGNPPIEILVRPNSIDATTNRRQNTDCLDANTGVGSDTTAPTETQRIPDTFTVGKPSSFYVCVNRTQNAARIYLRGNAIARLRPNQTESLRRVNDTNSSLNSTFLSTGNIRAFGRGKVVTQ